MALTPKKLNALEKIAELFKDEVYEFGRLQIIQRCPSNLESQREIDIYFQEPKHSEHIVKYIRDKTKTPRIPRIQKRSKYIIPRIRIF